MMSKLDVIRNTRWEPVAEEYSGALTGGCFGNNYLVGASYDFRGDCFH